MQIAEGRSDNSLQENEQTKASERPLKFCLEFSTEGRRLLVPKFEM